jgi:hypothetical protein
VESKTPHVATEAPADNEVQEESKVGENNNMISFSVVDELQCWYPECVFVDIPTSPHWMYVNGNVERRADFVTLAM